MPLHIPEGIEPTGWRVLCNGARRDTWPSGMARDMGAGLKIYVLRQKPLTGDDLVDTFAPAGPELVSTLTDQIRFASRFFGVPEKTLAGR